MYSDFISELPGMQGFDISLSQTVKSFDVSFAHTSLVDDLVLN
jgi:hypothetical protein